MQHLLPDLYLVIANDCKKWLRAINFTSSTSSIHERFFISLLFSFFRRDSLWHTSDMVSRGNLRRKWRPAEFFSTTRLDHWFFYLPNRRAELVAIIGILFRRIRDPLRFTRQYSTRKRQNDICFTYAYISFPTFAIRTSCTDHWTMGHVHRDRGYAAKAFARRVGRWILGPARIRPSLSSLFVFFFRFTVSLLFFICLYLSSSSLSPLFLSFCIHILIKYGHVRHRLSRQIFVDWTSTPLRLGAKSSGNTGGRLAWE